MADTDWGAPGQPNSPLEAAMIAQGLDPKAQYPVGPATTGTAGTQYANQGRTTWGGPGQPNSPLEAALLAQGVDPNVNYAVNTPTTGLAGTEFSNLGFHGGATPVAQLPQGGGPMGPPGGGPPGGPMGPPGGGPMGPPPPFGYNPGGTRPGQFPPPRPNFGPTPEQWAQFRQDGSAATQGINRMPYVFPGDQHSYQALATMPPADIFNTFYKPGGTPGTAAAPAGGGSGLDPNVQKLISQFAPQLGGLALGAGIGGLGGLGGTSGTRS